MDVRVTASAFDPQKEEALFSAGHTDKGALVSFVGRCRSQSRGRIVTSMFVDHYAGFTEREMTRISGELAARCQCDELLVIHRVGHVLPGEAIVLVAALSEHRAKAFETVRLVMDYLKTDAPLWKREIGPAGEHWVEPSAEDQQRRADAEEQAS